MAQQQEYNNQDYEFDSNQYDAEHDINDGNADNKDNAQNTPFNSVFVGNLGFSVTSEELKAEFEQIGQVTDAHIFITITGKSKGSGLVTFVKAEDAQKCLQEMQNKQIKGRPVFVRQDLATQGVQKDGRPLPSRLLANKIRIETPIDCQIFIGNLPFSTTWYELRDMCAPYGEVVRSDILRDSMTGRSRGSGTVVFATKEAAAEAVAKLDKTSYKGRNLVVHIDTHAGCKLFVGNIPFSMGWQDLKKLFGEYGTVVRADVERMRGYGTVSFTNRAEADAAIAALNGKKYEERVLIVKHDSKAYAV